MFEGRRIAAVIPAHNEERQITGVIDTIPSFVDKIIVIDDKSNDKTADIASKYALQGKIDLIKHQRQTGVGGAIITGYKTALRENFDIAVVMGGDGQMDPDELPGLLRPLTSGIADYAKGNRLDKKHRKKRIPLIRHIGIAVLTFMTRIISCNWQLNDSQSGYTAITKNALASVGVDNIYRGYGYPNDLLIKLSAYGFRITDVPVTPVYDIGERSKMRIWKVVPSILLLLFRLSIWRIKNALAPERHHSLFPSIK